MTAQISLYNPARICEGYTGTCVFKVLLCKAGNHEESTHILYPSCRYFLEGEVTYPGGLMPSLRPKFVSFTLFLRPPDHPRLTAGLGAGPLC